MASEWMNRAELDGWMTSFEVKTVKIERPLRVLPFLPISIYIYERFGIMVLHYKRWYGQNWGPWENKFKKLKNDE